MLELRDFQKHGAFWLASHDRGLLADEMRLGKTVQAIAACDLLHSDNILVLCPAVARANWEREFHRFGRLHRITKVIRTTADTYDYHPRDVTICSYELAEHFRQNAAWVASKWDILILDENHYLKSTDAKRTKTVYGKEGLVRRAKRIWALTGTPMPNHPGELWVLLYTFAVTPLSYDRFVERYCNYYIGPRGRVITGTKAAHWEELREMVKSVSLRRLARDVIGELPPPITETVVEPGIVYLSQEDKEKLEREAGIVEEALADTRFAIRALELLANSVSTLRRYCGLQKIEPVAELVAMELLSGAYEKVVIFAHHRDVVFGIAQKLKAFNPVIVYGGIPSDEKQNAIDAFTNDSTTRVFVGNILSAGVAINLSAANHVVFAEQDWVPGNNAQAAKRCSGITQKKSVFVQVVSLVESIDERISSVLRRKTEEIYRVIDSAD